MPATAILELLKADIKAARHHDSTAFENAMVTVMALGGSTNAVLHLIAMARSVDVDLTNRRLPIGQRPHPIPGRSEAKRQVCAGRPSLDRRARRP